MSKKILVIGAGVSGLSSALLLNEAGYETAIWAKDMPENTTSAVAAAFWAPYLSEPNARLAGWCESTYNYLVENLLVDELTGVSEIPMRMYFDEPTDELWWSSIVGGFKRLTSDELPDGYKDGHEYELILMDTSIYLPWLEAQVKSRGVTVAQRTISDFSNIPTEYDLVINCTGLGAKELCGDNRLHPVRGQVVKIAPGKPQYVIADDTGHNSLAYIIPRSQDIVLGGTAQIDNWGTEVSPEDTKAILQKARRLYPLLPEARILEERVGLRPYRDEVRLESEVITGRAVIHNYGHGGSGYTLSWGCAQDVVQHAKEAIGN